MIHCLPWSWNWWRQLCTLTRDHDKLVVDSFAHPIMCDRIQSNETLVYHCQDLKPKTWEPGFKLNRLVEPQLRGEKTPTQFWTGALTIEVLSFKIWFQRDHGQPAFGCGTLTKKFQSPEMPPSLGWKKDPSKLQLKNGNQICTAFSLLLKRVICLTSYSWRLELSRFLSLFNRKKYIIGNQTVAEENLVLHFTTNSGGL